MAAGKRAGYGKVSFPYIDGQRNHGGGLLTENKGRSSQSEFGARTGKSAVLTGKVNGIGERGSRKRQSEEQPRDAVQTHNVLPMNKLLPVVAAPSEVPERLACTQVLANGSRFQSQRSGHR